MSLRIPGAALVRGQRKQQSSFPLCSDSDRVHFVTENFLLRTITVPRLGFEPRQGVSGELDALQILEIKGHYGNGPLVMSLCEKQILAAMMCTLSRRCDTVEWSGNAALQITAVASRLNNQRLPIIPVIVVARLEPTINALHGAWWRKKSLLDRQPYRARRSPARIGYQNLAIKATRNRATVSVVREYARADWATGPFLTMCPYQGIARPLAPFAVGLPHAGVCSRKYLASFSIWLTPGSMISRLAIFSTVRWDTSAPMATVGQLPFDASNCSIT